MRFFEPKPKFNKWIKSIYNEFKFPVIDAGCGDGDLVREMRDNGIAALGIDFRYTLFDEKVPHDLCSCILDSDAETNILITGSPSIILVCRPCHSGFPGNINSNRHENSIMYYIGFEKNIEFDLGEVKLELIMKNIGKDNENIWKVERANV